MTQSEINNTATSTQKNGLEIAVIGMAGRFPGASTVDTFWHNLRDGVESISFFSDEELRSVGIRADQLKNPKFVKAKGILQNIEWFDASYFGYTPREAEIMDPQQRIFLECAVAALESAGYNPDMYKGLIGVYAGAGMNTYLLKNLYSHPELIESVGDFETMIGNDKDYLSTRVSYKLNLEGPSVVVQTACSTSLVSVCLACQSLLSGECDIVLAGGVSINLPQKTGYLYQEGGILSSDGHCRAFDSKAQGTAFSSAVGIVVLKRLEDALSDKDSIHAVIKGSAINNDGSFKVGFTAPRVDGQAKAIRAAQIMAEINPATISYIEAHGTGTPLGDPIEVAALKQVFGAAISKKGFCAIGSVKTNIGHADAAAGIAGLIRTVLMLKHREIPPSLHFEEPNPKIDFVNSPFYVNTELKPWQVDDFPRRAGVSSFGMGGTNAHVVLEEAPQMESSQPSRPWQLVLLSAKSLTALEAMTVNLAEHLKQCPNIKLADVAYTLQVGRKVLAYRRMVVCRDPKDAIAALDSLDDQLVVSTFQEPVNRDLVFMFSGQGSQYVNMGLELYRTESAFREQIDRCAEILKPQLDLDLRTILYPDEEKLETASLQLIQTSITQVALFVVEYALAQLWMTWGVRPTAMVGHSIGEYVAACLSRVFSLEDGLSMVVARGRMMQQRPEGSMLAVALSEQETEPFLCEDISLSAVNGPSLCVVSGEIEAIDKLAQTLSEKGIPCRPLHTSHAFHSQMMAPIVEEFTRQVKQVQLSVPQIPFVSNVTGNWIKAEEATDPNYWARHLRQTVRFADGMQELIKDTNRVFLEVGPGNTLNTLARQYPDKSAEQLVVSSLRHPKEHKSDTAVILDTLGRLWLAGIQLNWSEFYADEKRCRIPLPTYPFERQRYWVEPAKPITQVDFQKISLNKNPDPTEWLYAPAWIRGPKRESKPRSQEKPRSRWLLFMDQNGLGSQLLNSLQKEGYETATVIIGEKFAQTNSHDFIINPNNQEDYFNLIRELKARNTIPHSIIHLWSISAHKNQAGIKYFEHLQPFGFYSLLYLCKAIENQSVTEAINIEVIANGVHKVVGSEDVIPEKATILGPCKVIPQEYTNIFCRFIDVSFEDSRSSSMEKLTAQLLSELTGEFSDPIVAYRDGQRWLQTFESVTLNEDLNDTKEKLPKTLRQNGVYLITGGLGNVGLVMAEYLAKSVQAKLILTGRSGLPPKEEWQKWLTTHDASDIVSQKIHKVQSLEQMGAEVLIIKADVSSENEMMAAFNQIYYHFGMLHGVIHVAGIVDASEFRFIHELNQVDCEKHFLPKVYGLYVLQKLLMGKQLDFCQVVSSIASVLGGLGYSAYSAANIFMDTFVQKHRIKETIPWTSVNWDVWRFKEEKNKGLGSSLAELGITPEEGLEVLQNVVSMENHAQLVVSTADLETRVNQWVKLETLRENQATAHESSFYGPIRLPSKEDNAAAVDQVEQTIAAIWQKLLGIDQIGIHDDFFELGGSSLTALRLFAEIENIFDKKISLAKLFQASTVEQLASIVRQKECQPDWASLVTIQANGSNPPLFFIHGAEGNILLYRELAHHLGPDQPVYGLQSQGLDGRKVLLTRIEDIAAHYINEIRTLQPEGPYYIGGYCMGGVVTFEMAQQLYAQGQRVNLLAMFETYNPHSSFNSTSIFSRIYHTLQNIVFHCQNFLKLTPKEKLKFFSKKAMVEKSRIKEGMSVGLSKIAYRLSLNKGSKYPHIPIKRVNDQAFFSYKPQVYPGQVTLFRPQKFFFGADDPQFGWDGLAKEGLDVYELPVNPRGMLVEPFVQLLADKLKTCIQKSLETEVNNKR
jgi:acyl transferase domain-containing protein/thioesterase domain-containing protein/acyl carrier protein